MKQISRCLLCLAILVRGVFAEWQLHGGLNCFSGHGAGAGIPGGNPAPGRLRPDACKVLCEANPDCDGVIVQKGQPSGVCYLRKQLSVAGCMGSRDFDLWLLTAREGPGRELGMGMGEEPRIQPPPLSIAISILPRAVFKNHEGGYNLYRIPALVRVGGAEVLAFIEGRRSGSDAGHIDLVMKRSTNDGADWGPIQIVAGGSGDIARGNPSPVYCETTGRLLLVWSWNNLDLYVQSSDDKGKTWSDARKFSHMVKRPGWGWVATGPGHAIQLRRGEHEGRIVVPFNAFFADALMKKVVHRRGCAGIDECSHYYSHEEQTQDVRVEIENPLDPEMGTLRSRWYNGTTELPLYVWAGDRSGVFYSDDGGDTWQLGGMVNSRIGSSECQVAETDEGLFISFRVEDKDSGCRKMAFSRDGGQSFEDFFEPQVCIPDPVCQGSMVALEDGRLVTCGPGTSSSREDITLHISHGSADQSSLGFARLGLVEGGDGGYSDIVLLEPGPSGRARVGVIWEHGFAGGAGYAVVDMPPAEETEFKDPEDPWATLLA